jgi:hypothetical protein
VIRSRSARVVVGLPSWRKCDAKVDEAKMDDKGELDGKARANRFWDALSRGLRD